MNLLHLEQFYEVAKVGSVSVGARKLRLSQPALSKSIKLLEENLGVTLFERSKKGMELTAAGKLAFERASRIFSESKALGEEIRLSSGELSGEWCVGASDNIALYLLPPVAARFKRDHPRIRLQIFAGTSGDIKNEILADRAQIGLFFTQPKTYEPFQVKEIGAAEFWIVMSSKIRVEGRKPRFEDLQKGLIPRIESRHKDYGAGFPAHFHAKKLGLTHPPAIETNLHEIKKRLILEGAGYAIITRHTVEEEVKSGKLFRIQTPKPLPAPIYLVMKKNRVSDATFRAWMFALRELRTFSNSLDQAR